MHVDAEVDEEGDAVHVPPGGRQVQRRVAEVVAALGVAAPPHQQPQRVQVPLERGPSGRKGGISFSIRSTIEDRTRSLIKVLKLLY